MNVFREPVINGATPSERVDQLKKELSRLVRELNMQAEMIERKFKEIEGRIPKNGENQN